LLGWHRRASVTAKDNRQSLVLRDVQHEYVFVEVMTHLRHARVSITVPGPSRE
jgi:hypothetical protein